MKSQTKCFPKKRLTGLLLLCIIPVVVLGGAVVFRDRFYAWISLAVAVLSCLPLFYAFEKRSTSSGELMLLAVMVALTVVGRIVFVWFPAFKPVTAITIIAAIALGREAGFIVGSMSAVLSNFYFGQGPWTPFQMFVWGLIGFLGGCFAARLAKKRLLLILFGVASAFLFSAVMDIWSVLWTNGTFALDRYLAAMLSALPTTALYAVSNTVFLWLFAGPLGSMLERIKRKYGLFGATV